MRRLPWCVNFPACLSSRKSSCICPEEFAIYLNYVRKLGFEETPDYDFLRELFAKVLKNNGDVEDGVYDWNLLNGKPHPSCPMNVALKRVPWILIRWQRLGSIAGAYSSRPFPSPTPASRQNTPF